ncbi:kinase-like protein [Gigaspora margarita]|uniref:Kinase-like protein n=1 Tax=Gigaspora margarita TaxID=4874 RepID=A0A8H3X912_GIGMA|nr:kinase-like protein [Gigaspora margarita]
MVLQFANGGTLCDYLKTKQEKGIFNISWAELIRIAIEITDGLKYIHSKSIIHRDLHSNNILINDGKAMINFATSSFSDVHRLAPLIPYAYPQLLSNDQLKHNEKSDIYSLGVLFWELAIGVPPFQRFPRNTILSEILKGKKEIPIVNAPSDYISLFQKCWSLNPENRPTLDEISLTLDVFTSRAVNQSGPD